MTIHAERTRQAPARPATSRPRASIARTAHALGLVTGLAGLVLAAVLPFAPVWNDRTTVHWPAAGEPATPTTAFLTPYRPVSFHATVPCAGLRAALAPGAERSTILATTPPGLDRPGLIVAAQRGALQVVLGERQVPLPPPSAARCDLVIDADAHQTTMVLGDRPPIRLPGVAAPEIFVLDTDLPPEQAAGLQVTARAFAWFDTSPTDLKSSLVHAALILLACSLVLLVAASPPTRVPAPRVRPGLLLADLGLAGVLACWAVIGPVADDDGWAALIARNGDDMTNYYRWFDASELFTLVHQVVRQVSELSLQPVVLRLPSVAAGLLTWLVVSRGIVHPLCRSRRPLGLHLLTAVFFLACWLPFNLGVRPEAFVALGYAATFAALLKATRPDSTAPFGWLGLAALAAGSTIAVTPSGVVVLCTVALFAPKVVRTVAGSPRAPWWAIAARAAMLLGVGSVGLVALFADSTAGAVFRATEIRDELGPSLGWYEEIQRYEGLLGTTTFGAAGKRLAVLLTVVAMLLLAAGILRRTHRAAGLPGAGLLLGALTAGFAAMWLTPTKWSHHFGALAGLSAPVLAVAVVLLARAGGLAGARRAVRVLGPAGLGLVALAAGLSFVGPNAWPTHSDYGVPWSDSPVRPGGLPLDNPVLWLLAGAAAGGVVALRPLVVRSRARTRHPAGNPGWTAMPASALTLAALTSVAVLLGGFLAAPSAMAASYSVGGDNWDRLTNGPRCGLEDHVELLPLAAGGTLHPVAAPAARPVLDGFVAGGGLPGRPMPAEPRRGPRALPHSATPHVWGSLRGGPVTTGSLATEWFALPALAPEQLLSLWLAGRPEQGNTVSVEFGQSHGPGSTVRPLGTVAIRDPAPAQLPYDDPRHGRDEDWRDFRPWRNLTVQRGAVPEGADRVRVLAEDRSTDPQGWLAVSAPVVRDIVPLARFLRARSPVLVDQMIGFVFPCVDDYPVVEGTARAPRVVLSPAEGPMASAFHADDGGVFAGVRASARLLEVPSRLAGAPGHTWGHVYVPQYRYETDAYDVRRQRVRIGGADGQGAYPFTE
ncbi:arabinosyltransferase domain-containing protein [Prauserella muralis]|uniref:Uncharacterized protein n=1 Tax=Prauserella muralis TaxID=588067 RepID=A0A2V4ANP5_9PSEU|nr:arabinosyltransferase domain-containing protein [Prauserella muralis]PXY22197.1 hypothetical protein BAY60_20110 [Prauserella muralis]TWE27807.1 arabinosyltransferase C [Prauserella muralis]TWE27812.1 arabinosyltransferase C [Prauserella muralis]TWE27825.1 arabinosyltransferase C [Prauserella muralis]